MREGDQEEEEQRQQRHAMCGRCARRRPFVRPFLANVEFSVTDCLAQPSSTNLTDWVKNVDRACLGACVRGGPLPKRKRARLAHWGKEGLPPGVPPATHGHPAHEVKHASAGADGRSTMAAHPPDPVELRRRQQSQAAAAAAPVADDVARKRGRGCHSGSPQGGAEIKVGTAITPVHLMPTLPHHHSVPPSRLRRFAPGSPIRPPPPDSLPQTPHSVGWPISTDGWKNIWSRLRRADCTATAL